MLATAAEAAGRKPLVMVRCAVWWLRVWVASPGQKGKLTPEPLVLSRSSTRFHAQPPAQTNAADLDHQSMGGCCCRHLDQPLWPFHPERMPPMSSQFAPPQVDVRPQPMVSRPRRSHAITGPIESPSMVACEKRALVFPRSDSQWCRGLCIRTPYHRALNRCGAPWQISSYFQPTAATGKSLRCFPLSARSCRTPSTSAEDGSHHADGASMPGSQDPFQPDLCHFRGCPGQAYAHEAPSNNAD